MSAAEAAVLGQLLNGTEPDQADPQMQEYEAEIARNIYALAKEHDCTPVLPQDDRQVLLDLDGLDALQAFHAQLEVFNRWVVQVYQDVAVVQEQWVSKSGEGYHVIIRLPFEVEDDAERVLYQALFGSDIKRELFNQLRILLGVDEPITLFRPKVPAAG